MEGICFHLIYSPDATTGWPVPGQGSRNSIRVSIVGDRNPKNWGIICYVLDLEGGIWIRRGGKTESQALG